MKKLSYAISAGEGTLIEYGSIDSLYETPETDPDELDNGTIIIGPYDGTGE